MRIINVFVIYCSSEEEIKLLIEAIVCFFNRNFLSICLFCVIFGLTLQSETRNTLEDNLIPVLIIYKCFKCAKRDGSWVVIIVLACVCI